MYSTFLILQKVQRAFDLSFSLFEDAPHTSNGVGSAILPFEEKIFWAIFFVITPEKRKNRLG